MSLFKSNCNCVTIQKLPLVRGIVEQLHMGLETIQGEV